MESSKLANDDLGYIRAVAERGALAPLTGGRFMAWWGALVAIAYTAHHFALAGQFGGRGTATGLIWLAFGVTGPLGQIILQRGAAGRPGAGAAGNLAARTVWLAGALAIVALVGGIVIAVARGAPPSAFDWIVPTAFAVYACALVVTGDLAGDRMVKTAGYGAVAMVALFAVFHLDPNRYLLAAAGAALTVMLPGLLLMRRDGARG